MTSKKIQIEKLILIYFCKYLNIRTKCQEKTHLPTHAPAEKTSRKIVMLNMVSLPIKLYVAKNRRLKNNLQNKKQKILILNPE